MTRIEKETYIKILILFIVSFLVGIFLYKKITLLLFGLVGIGIPVFAGLVASKAKYVYFGVVVLALSLSLLVCVFYLGR